MRTRSTRLGLFIFVVAALAWPMLASAGPTTATVSVSPTSISVSATVGQNVASQTVQVTKSGAKAVKWSIVAPAASWVRVSPTSGTNAGTLTLTFATTTMSAGQYSTSFGVKTATTTLTVPVSVNMIAPTAPAPEPTPEPTPDPTPTPTPDPTPDPTFSGTTIYVSTSGLDSNIGTQANPVRTIQRAVQLAADVNSAGQAALIAVAAGTYRESVNLPGQKTDAALTIEGAGSTATILTGSDNWSSGWTLQGDGSYTHAWPYAWGMAALPSGWSGYWSALTNPDKDTMRRSETVYVNGSALQPTLSLASMVAGKFYVNETTHTLHMRLPAGVTMPAQIEVGTRVTPLRINGRRNVTVKKLAVLRSRGAIMETGLWVTNSQNITLEDLTVRWLAYQGYGSGYNTTIRIRRSVFSDNGVVGIAQLRDRDVIIEDSEIARNNWRGWPVGLKGWGSVFKWAAMRDAAVRRSRFVNNWGNGFWVDSDNKRITLENSLLSGNQMKGVSLEKNQGPITLIGNRICNNIEAGLADAQSDRVTVKNNQIWGTTKYNFMFTGNYNGQTFTDFETGTSYTGRSLYWTFTGNTIVGNGTEGWLWWHTDWNAPGAWADTRNSMIALDYNTWYHSGRTTAFKLPQGSVAFSTFRSDVQLASSQFEVHSPWTVPPTLSCTLP
jgi:hypothetical protein